MSKWINERRKIRCLWWKKQQPPLITSWWGQRQSAGTEVFLWRKLLFILPTPWEQGVDSKVVPQYWSEAQWQPWWNFPLSSTKMTKLGQCSNLFLKVNLFTLKACPLFWNYCFSGIKMCSIMNEGDILCVSLCCMCAHLMFWLGKIGVVILYY